MSSSGTPKESFFEDVVNPYMNELKMHPKELLLIDGELRIKDVQGPKGEGSLEDRMEKLEQEVFNYKKMAEREVDIFHKIVSKLIDGHKKETAKLWDDIISLHDTSNKLQAQLYDVQNQNCFLALYNLSEQALPFPHFILASSSPSSIFFTHNRCAATAASRSSLDPIMVKKENSVATSSVSGGVAAKASPYLPKSGDPDAPPPAPAPPAPSSSTAGPNPSDWPASTTTRRDEKRARSPGLIPSDEGNVIQPVNDISDTAGSMRDDDADHDAFVDAAVEDAKASPVKRPSGSFVDKDDLFDLFRGFGPCCSPRGLDIDCVLPFQGEGYSFDYRCRNSFFRETSGKQLNNRHPIKCIVTMSRPLELLHLDLFGPSHYDSLGGSKYGLVIVDDYSRYSWVFLLKSKDDTHREFIIFSKKAQRMYESEIKAIRTDNGTEFKNYTMQEFVDDEGIKHEFSAPYTPQQNGVVERKNLTINEMARTMLGEFNSPHNFWAEAISTAVHYSNRLFLRPSITKLHTSFSQNSHAYRYYNKSTRAIEISCDVEFLEDNGSQVEQVFPCVAGNDDDPSSAIKLMGIGHIRPIEVHNDDQDDGIEVSSSAQVEPSSTQAEPSSATQDLSSTQDEPHSKEQEESPQPTKQDHDDDQETSSTHVQAQVVPHDQVLARDEFIDHEGTIRKIKAATRASDMKVHQVLGSVSKGVVTRRHHALLITYCQHHAFVSIFEPLKVHEALVDPDWVIAMQEELECFTRNEVWSLVERHKDHSINVIGTKWVFKNKQDENGIVIRNKARFHVGAGIPGVAPHYISPPSTFNVLLDSYWNTPPVLEAILKEFISTQTAFNKSVEEKLGKIDILASKVDSLAADVDLLKLKVMPNRDNENKIVTTANSIQFGVEEVFKDQERRMIYTMIKESESSKLGDARWFTPTYIKKTQASNLGDAQGIPFFIDNIIRFHVGAGIPGVAPHYISPPSTFNVLLDSYWFDKPWFLTEGKLVAVHIIPSSWGSQRHKEATTPTSVVDNTNPNHNKAFKLLMTRKFEMSMMGELKFFLGFQVRQLAKGTFISQEKYVKDMLKKFNMTNASPMKTPMPVKGQLGSCDGEKDVDIKTRRRQNEFMAARNAPVPPSGPEMEPVIAPAWEMPPIDDEMFQNFDFSMYAHGGLPPRTARAPAPDDDDEDDEEYDDEGGDGDDDEGDDDGSPPVGTEFY
ncbi:hypothetical protein QYE76_028726 [Lolium multiflorum]|uniref:Integrase catalytic domain-containing protein n=1 Tax=Lolium multiflorum TaxID=4521 RepID=A0AAD8QQ32_LOLMU|nr:hypothetical protein QYE76_028726 [Lolium multiflorum]